MLDSLERDCKGAPCTCNGYADRLDNYKFTKEEINSDLNCSRHYACCIAAFKCRLCGTTFVASLNAPEVGW